MICFESMISKQIMGRLFEGTAGGISEGTRGKFAKRAPGGISEEIHVVIIEKCCKMFS